MSEWGYLKSDNWYSYLNGQQKYKYVVYLRREDIFKYKEINELDEFIRQPQPQEIIYNKI